MHQRVVKLSAVIASFAVGLTTFLTTPVFADECGEGCVETSFFGCQCGKDGIIHVLSTVVNIMTAGIAILAVIGVVVSGVQYLTAGGNEEKTRKAKRRIFEIVIGLAAYVAIYALLNWLLPGFNGINF